MDSRTPGKRHASIAVALATAGVLAYQSYAAFVRFLINDDYQTLYTAWLKAEGKVPGRDFFLASYYLLTDLIAPLFRIAPQTWAPLYIARLTLVGVMALIGWIVFRLTGALFGKPALHFAPVVTLVTSAMLYRGLDLRPDLLTTAAWLAIFLLLATRSSATGDALTGALMALSLINRFKAGLIVPFVVVAYFVASRSVPTAIRKLMVVAGAMLTVLAAYVGWVAWSTGLQTFFAVNTRLFAGMQDYAELGRGIRAQTCRDSLRLDPLFWILTLSGVILRTKNHRRFGMRENYLTLALAALGAATVIFNPIYYSYNLVTLMPLLAPFAAYALAGAAVSVSRRVRSPRLAGAIPILFAIAPVVVQAHTFVYVLRPDNTHQKDLQRFLLRHTAADARVFALEGVGLFRPSTYHWRIPWIYIGRYTSGEWRFSDEFRRTPPEIVILSYRVPGWLVESDRVFLATHYVSLAGAIMVPGFDTHGRDGTFEADLLVGGEYETLKEGTGSCTIDGISFQSGTRIPLRSGVHPIVASGARCALRRYYPIEARLLVVDPERLPYFAGPFVGPLR